MLFLFFIYYVKMIGLYKFLTQQQMGMVKVPDETQDGRKQASKITMTTL